MTDNEIKREQPSFEVRAESLKKRTKEFFSTYENPSGSEDRLEICLIREGYRAVLMAEEEINRQKAEIAKLTLDLKVIQHTATKYPHCVMRDNVAIFTKSPEDYDRWVSDITLEIFKFYAERLKKTILSQLGISTMEKKEAYHFCIDEIDNLVKEMERSNELWKRRADNLLKEMVGEG